MVPSSLFFRANHGHDHPQTKASFEYEISSDKIIQVIDLDEGKSVTNDIESVLSDIALAEDLATLADHQVIYADTDKHWSRVMLTPAGRFSHFATLGGITDQAEAVHRVRNGWQPAAAPTQRGADDSLVQS